MCSAEKGLTQQLQGCYFLAKPRRVEETVERSLSFLLTMFALSLLSTSTAEANCLAGRQCPQETCFKCVDFGGGDWRCAIWLSNARCGCASGGGNCFHVGGFCSYGICITADGQGPCAWNAPPAREGRWVRARRRSPEASGRSIGDQSGWAAGTRHEVES